MDRTARNENLISKALVLVIALLTLVILFLQYQWFDQAASARIAETRRELRRTVFLTVVREYQRFNRVLDTLRLRSLDSLGPDEAVADLTGVARHFGPGGPETGFLGGLVLVSGDGQVLLDSGGYAEAGFVQTWREGLGEYGRGQNEPDRLVLLREGEGAVRSPPVLAGKAAGGRVLFFLVLDTSSFFADWVIPAVREAWPDWRVELGQSSGIDFPGGPDQDPVPGYHFNPLTALAGLGGHQDDRLRIVVPDLQDEVFKVRSQGDGSRLVARQPPSESGAGVHRPGRLVLVFSGGPGNPAVRVETEIALSWAATTFLILLVGTGFALVLIQSRRLRALRRQEREFVAGITHELRTPLTVIQAAGDNLASGSLGPERTGEYGRLILDQSRRLGRMIEEVIEFSRVEGGHSPSPSWQVLDRDVLVRGLKDQLDPLAASRGISLVWDTRGLPVSFTADPDSLRLVVENLVANAVHHAYLDAGNREVRCIMRLGLPDRILVTVEDDGRGVLPQDARRIFEPFYRDAVSRARQEKGSGLGLYLVSRRIEAQGGKVTLESPYRRLDGSKRQGCRFQAVLRIPQDKADLDSSHGGLDG